MVRLHVFGTVALEEAGGSERREIPIQPKRMALLAYLAVAAPRPWHRRDTLLALFWPELDQEHARGALNKAVHYLRRHLGEGILASRGDDELALEPGCLWIDALAFEEHLEEGRPEEALALYRGDLLRGFHVSASPDLDRWVERERERLRTAARDAAWVLAEQNEVSGRPPEAIRWARWAASLSPADELGLRRLLGLLNRMGNRAEAVRAYEAFARRLCEDFDLEPSTETSELVDAIRAGVVGDGDGRRSPAAHGRSFVHDAAHDGAGSGVESDASAAETGRGTDPAPVAEWPSPAVPSPDRPTRERPRHRRRWRVLHRLAALLISVGVLAVLVRWTSADWLEIASGTSRPDVIAIVPFNTSGEVGLSGEGVAYLLSANLDGVGGIRLRPPRTVMSRWDIVSAGGSPRLDEVLELGRDAEAGSVLTGSIVSAGARVRLDATLYSVTGERLGGTRVAGPADSALALVDSLALRLLREILRVRSPELGVRASAITSAEFDAIREFLRGERHFRRFQFDSAATAFQQALHVDSTFALAHYRLASVYEWNPWAHTPRLRREHYEAALRQKDRLPTRERSLLEARLTGLRDTPTAGAAALAEHVERYPDDAEAWFWVGDARFHGSTAARDVGDLVPPLQRALELDPLFGPAVLHLLDLIPVLDSATVDRLATTLRQGGNDVDAERFRVVGAVLWGSLDSLPSAFTGPLANLVYRRSLLYAASFRSSRYDPEQVLRTLDRLSASLPLEDPRPECREPGPPLNSVFCPNLMHRDLWFHRALILIGTGQLRAAAPLLDSLAAKMPEWAHIASMGAVTAGMAEAGFLRGRAGGVESLALKLATGDPEEARALAEQRLARASDAPSRAKLEASLGWAHLLEGDTAAALEAFGRGLGPLERVLFTPGPGEPALYFRWFEALAHAPETRPAALRALSRTSWEIAFVYETLSHLVRARAMEASGDREGARRAYARFLELLEGADPDVGIRDEIDAAVASLARLGPGT